VTRAGLFSGIWRLPAGRVTWFVEQPARPSEEGQALLRELSRDEDALLRRLAGATSPEHWVEWRAEDCWPPRALHRRNVVLVGDAAHAMLPTLGQGACQSLEDAAALAAAIEHEPTVETALRRYEVTRVPRVRRIMMLARMGAVTRRPSVATRATPSVVAARVMAVSSGPILRRLTTPQLW
jgi:2-polyprenyl-6-methoxyphenol hydroxylase-like FAD-dependent oxidoreductase